ncbi:MAG: response regulator [Synechococcales bacterium]|nr:response regulator [Synechococcales bacterium]
MTPSNSPLPLATASPLLYPVTAYYIRKLLRQNLDRLHWLANPTEPIPPTVCEDLMLLLEELYPEAGVRHEIMISLEQLVLTHQTISPQGPKYRLQLGEIEQKIYRILGFQLARIKKGTILIVDDTPENLRLLMITLSRQGYEVSTAISGFLALETVVTIVPDLILLDSKMPGMDGYEVCRQLKVNPVTQPIPVIFISARDDAGDKVRAFRCGAVDYITKPFQVEEVLARVDHHLQLSNLQQRLTEQNIRLQQEIHRRNPTLHPWQQGHMMLIKGWIRDRKLQNLQQQWRLTTQTTLQAQLTSLVSQIAQLRGSEDHWTIVEREQQLQTLELLAQQMGDRFGEFCQLDQAWGDRTWDAPAVDEMEWQVAGNAEMAAEEKAEEAQTFDLIRFCHHVVIQVQSSVGRAHQIRFYDRVTPQRPNTASRLLPVALNQRWLYQLLYNLFSYTAIAAPKGSQLVLELCPLAEDLLLLRHSHSCPLPLSETLDILTHPWQQVIERVIDVDREGLDLAIARQAADQLKIPLTVESAEMLTIISFPIKKA